MTLADFGSFAMLSAAETIGQERAKVTDFWAPGRTAKSAGTRVNPTEHAGIGKKKSNQMSGWISYMVEQCGPGFKLSICAGEYCYGCFSLFLEVVRFASWK